MRNAPMRRSAKAVDNFRRSRVRAGATGPRGSRVAASIECVPPDLTTAADDFVEIATFTCPTAAQRLPDAASRANDPRDALIEDLERALANATRDTERKVCEYLLTVARANGELPRTRGLGLSRAAVEAAAGLSPEQLNPGLRPRKLLDEFASRFRLASKACRVRNGLIVARPPTLADRLQTYLEDRITDGAAIPRHNGMVSRKGVADAIGDTPARVSREPTFKTIVDAVRDGRVRLGDEYVGPSGRASAVDSRARLEMLKAVVASFDVAGGKIPESATVGGKVNWEHIASLTGTTHPTMQNSKRYRRYTLEVAARRGLEPIGLRSGDDSVAVLRQHIADVVEAEVKAKNGVNAGVVVGNVRGAFDRLAAVADLQPEDDAAELFGPDFAARRDAILATFDNPGTAGNVRRALEKCREIHLRRAMAGELPTNFPECVKHLIGARDLTITSVARAVGCPSAVLMNWLNGGGVASHNLGVVERLEALFHLPRGLLLAMIGKTFASSSLRSKATQQYNDLDRKVRRLLPHEAAFWPPERLAEAVVSVAPLRSGATDYGRLCQLAGTDDFKLPPLSMSARLRSQIDGLVEYKCASGTFPLRRAPGAQWGKEATVSVNVRQIGGLYRFIGAPKGDTVISGLGLPIEGQTLAWLACPQLVLGQVGHRGGRFSKMDWRGERRGVRYGSMDVSLVRLVASLVNPHTGYVAQLPELAGELMPSDHGLPRQFDHLLKMFCPADGKLISEEDVAFARRDWSGFCNRAHLALMQAAEYLERVAEVSRNPFEPIDGLLKSPTPLLDFVGLTYAAETRWANERTAPEQFALDVRDAAMLRLHPITAFRPENLAGLTYSSDGKGQIRKLGGVWEIEIYYKDFKNYQQCRLFGNRNQRHNYKITLQDDAGLYGILDHYFFEVRPRKSAGAESRAAFFNRSGEAMNAKRYACSFDEYQLHNLAYNAVKGTGAPGVTSVCPYAIRHIRVADTLRNGITDNRVEEAAFAIQSSEEMIRDHYGFLLPGDALQGSYGTFKAAAGRAWRQSNGG